MKVLSKSVLVSLTALLAACATSGVYVSEEQVRDYKRGVTTVEQITSELGQPTQRSVDDQGNVTLVYAYTETSIRPASFIPYVGMVTGGADERSTAVNFKFNQKGLLQSYNFTGSQAGHSVGLASGASGERVGQTTRPTSTNTVE